LSDTKSLVLEIASRQRDRLNTWKSDEAFDLLKEVGIELLCEYPYYRQQIGPIKRARSVETSAEQHDEGGKMSEHDSEEIEAEISMAKRQKLV